MKPLTDRTALFIAWVGLAGSIAMLTACSRGDGHKHPLTAKPRDAAMIEEHKDVAKAQAKGAEKSAEKDHAAMGHGQAGAGNKKEAGGKSEEPSPQPNGRPTAAQAKGGGHEAMGHGSGQPSGGQQSQAAGQGAMAGSQKDQKPESALHVGAKGFFLDQTQKLTLAADQAKAIGEIKERAMMEMMDADKKVQEAEQQLWKLTSSDRPVLAQIETKVREVEKLRADQRIAFIRSVAAATDLLTAEQKKILVRENGDGKAQPNTSEKAPRSQEPAHKH